MTLSIALVAVLLFVIQDDLRNFRIRNEAVLTLIALFALRCLATGDLHALWLHTAYAGAVAIVTLGLFYIHVIGGGDAKLMIAAAFWLGLHQSSLFAVLLLLTALSYGLGAKIGILPARRNQGRTFIPFGPCIALAWLGTLVLLKSL